MLLAAREGHAAALKVLIEAGCDVDAADDHGESPAYLAAEEGEATGTRAPEIQH